MNFRPGDTPVDIGVLPRESGSEKESEGQFLLVLTTRGFGKRVSTDEFKLTRRWEEEEGGVRDDVHCLVVEKLSQSTTPDPNIALKIRPKLTYFSALVKQKLLKTCLRQRTSCRALRGRVRPPPLHQPGEGDGTLVGLGWLELLVRSPISCC